MNIDYTATQQVYPPPPPSVLYPLADPNMHYNSPQHHQPYNGPPPPHDSRLAAAAHNDCISSIPRETVASYVINRMNVPVKISSNSVTISLDSFQRLLNSSLPELPNTHTLSLPPLNDSKPETVWPFFFDFEKEMKRLHEHESRYLQHLQHCPSIIPSARHEIAKLMVRDPRQTYSTMLDSIHKSWGVANPTKSFLAQMADIHPKSKLDMERQLLRLMSLYNRAVDYLRLPESRMNREDLLPFMIRQYNEKTRHKLNCLHRDSFKPAYAVVFEKMPVDIAGHRSELKEWPASPRRRKLPADRSDRREIPEVSPDYQMQILPHMPHQEVQPPSRKRKRKKKSNKSLASSSRRNECIYCLTACQGGPLCPARGSRCKNCWGLNHWAQACQSPRQYGPPRHSKPRLRTGANIVPLKNPLTFPLVNKPGIKMKTSEGAAQATVKLPEVKQEE